jgi:hypothetical protein
MRLVPRPVTHYEGSFSLLGSPPEIYRGRGGGGVLAQFKMGVTSCVWPTCIYWYSL